jgi:hypothetical protein
VGAIEFSAPKKFIYSIQEKFQYSNFIETGTYMGETSIWASAYFKNVFTIEVNPELSGEAAMRASGKTNIRFTLMRGRTRPSLVVDRQHRRREAW